MHTVSFLFFAFICIVFGETDTVTIWLETMEESSVDLNDWTVTDTNTIEYRDNSDCPPGSTSCWSLCTVNGVTTSMYYTASTKRFEHIAFTFSIDPWSMYLANDEYCELSYSIDNINWTPFTPKYDSDDHIVDEIIFLDAETWDIDSMSVKISAHEDESSSPYVSCCYLSNLILSGAPIPTTINPLVNPTFDQTFGSSFNPTFVTIFNDGEGEETSSIQDTEANNGNNNDDKQNSLINGDTMIPVVMIGAGGCICLVLVIVVFAVKCRKEKGEHEETIENMEPGTSEPDIVDTIPNTSPVPALPIRNDNVQHVDKGNTSGFQECSKKTNPEMTRRLTNQSEEGHDTNMNKNTEKEDIDSGSDESDKMYVVAEEDLDDEGENRIEVVIETRRSETEKEDEQKTKGDEYYDEHHDKIRKSEIGIKAFG